MIFDTMVARAEPASRLLFVLCCAALACSGAWGANDGMDTSLVVARNAQHYVVQRDGSSTLTWEQLTEVAEERGVGEAGQRNFNVRTGLEDLEVIEAYTEKPDGRRIRVQPDQIKLQQQGQVAGAAAFQDVKIETIVFPEVAIGDKLYSKTRLTRHRALFDGQFSDFTAPDAHPTRELSLTYDLPADMPLKSDARGFKLASMVSAGGRNVYRWEYVPADVPRIESDTVSALDFGPRLLVATFQDQAQLGRAYDQAAHAAAVPGPRVKALVDTLVRQLADPRAKALAIDNWVRRNVRFVSVGMQDVGLHPHPADTVLENGYGDCQDHAALMQAMLAAAGIDSTPALINAGNLYRLSEAPSLDQFNHLIVYVPSLDLYLDSTALDIEAGYLRWDNLDKPVVLTRTGEIRHTPVQQAGRIWSRYRVRIAADGSATLDFKRGHEGWYEENARIAVAGMSAAVRAFQVKSILLQKGMKGSGTMDANDPTPTDPGYVVSEQGTVDDWAYLPGTVGIYADSSFHVGVSWVLHAMTREARRTQPYLCPDDDFTEDAVFELPAGASVLAVPKDTRVASPYFQYQSEFRLQGQTLRVHRRLKTVKADSRVCTPEDFQAMQPDIRGMMHDIRSQFILKMPEQALAVRPDSTGLKSVASRDER